MYSPYGLVFASLSTVQGICCVIYLRKGHEKDVAPQIQQIRIKSNEYKALGGWASAFDYQCTGSPKVTGRGVPFRTCIPEAPKTELRMMSKGVTCRCGFLRREFLLR